MRRVALTFDDGPSQWTPAILDLLKKHEALATFFVLGSNAAEHPELVERTIREGHEVGVHGWDHTPVDDLSFARVETDLRATVAQLDLHGARCVRWWRPPWHRITHEAAEAAERAGLSYCGVMVDGSDVNRTEEQIVTTVNRDIRAGAIIGLHDGVAANGSQRIPHRLNTVRAVDRILTAAKDEYTFVTVSELLA